MHCKLHRTQYNLFIVFSQPREKTKNTAGTAAGVSSPDALVPKLAGICLSSSVLSPPADSRHMNNGHGGPTNIPNNDSVFSKDGPLTTKYVYEPRPYDQTFVNMSANDIIHIKNLHTSIGRLLFY